MDTALLVFLVIVVIGFALYAVKRIWGLDLLVCVVQSRPIQAAIGSAIEAVSKVLPNEHFPTVIAVLNAASEGAKSAEDLWLMGELEKDERNAKAKEIAKAAIAKAGVEITPQIDMIVGGIIEVMCMQLPHGVEPVSKIEE